MDMTESIAPKSDQMNAEDLLSGPRTFTITEVREGSAEQPVSVFVAEHPQPFKPSKTVRRLMVVGWGPDSAAYIGKRMTLYRDPEVKFGGQDIGGIRVSHMSGIGRKPMTIALAVTRGKRGQYTVDPLPDQAPPRGGPSPLDAARPAPHHQPSGPYLPGEEEQRMPAQRQGITDTQLRKLGAAFSDLGVKGEGERAARLAVASKVAGRPVSSARELNAGEASVLINTLESIARGMPGTRANLDELLGVVDTAVLDEDQTGDADPDTDVDDAEPTDEEWDAMSGSEAEAEADRG
jgi:hypothetical protein